MPTVIPVTPLASNETIPGDHYGRGPGGVNQVRRGIPTLPHRSRFLARRARRLRALSAGGEAGPASRAASIPEIVRHDRTAGESREVAEFASGSRARAITRAGFEVRFDRCESRSPAQTTAQTTASGERAAPFPGHRGKGTASDLLRGSACPGILTRFPRPR